MKKNTLKTPKKIAEKAKKNQFKSEPEKKQPKKQPSEEKEWLLKQLEEVNDRLVYIGDKPGEYLDAVIGVTHDHDHLLYSYDKLVGIMMVRNRWSYEDAVEWIDYNTIRSCDCMGEFKPYVVYGIESFR